MESGDGEGLEISTWSFSYPASEGLLSCHLSSSVPNDLSGCGLHQLPRETTPHPRDSHREEYLPDVWPKCFLSPSFLLSQ